MSQPIDWNLYDQLKAQGLSGRKIAEQMEERTGVYRSTLLRAIKGRAGVPAVRGDTALAQREPDGALISAPLSAPRFDELESRVRVLEAFIATLQRQPAYPVSAPNGAPRSAQGSLTKKRGFVIACDLSDAVDAYATASGQRVTDILDRALRLYLGEVTRTEVHG